MEFKSHTYNIFVMNHAYIKSRSFRFFLQFILFVKNLNHGKKVSPCSSPYSHAFCSFLQDSTHSQKSERENTQDKRGSE